MTTAEKIAATHEIAARNTACRIAAKKATAAREIETKIDALMSQVNRLAENVVDAGLGDDAYLALLTAVSRMADAREILGDIR